MRSLEPLLCPVDLAAVTAESIEQVAAIETVPPAVECAIIKSNLCSGGGYVVVHVPTLPSTQARQGRHGRQCASSAELQW